MVTVEPLPSVATTIPPGLSRIKAPPPSAALMIAMIGVGSAVIVEVGVSVGGIVGVDVRVAPRVGVCVETPKTALVCSGRGDKVSVGTWGGVDEPGRMGTGSGVARPVRIMIHRLKPVKKINRTIKVINIIPVKAIPPAEVG